jgi:hypothetical protein
LADEAVDDDDDDDGREMAAAAVATVATAAVGAAVSVASDGERDMTSIMGGGDDRAVDWRWQRLKIGAMLEECMCVGVCGQVVDSGKNLLRSYRQHSGSRRRTPRGLVSKRGSVVRRWVLLVIEGSVCGR